ncbi:MAG TPA: TonB-dependent receptor [Vicinamibacterales bacterium]|nr:TonB-dependent receptor [Vicinamibacterales bacterium]
MVAKLSCVCVLLVLLTTRTGSQGLDSHQPQDLKRLSIEELTQVQVTSVSRRPESVARTAAAVSVVRQDDIYRSGTTTLAEALRLGDAIDVAQVSGSTWGITSRGFNISTANKLLVLIDGRSTYVPLFGGTFWDVQDTILADLDRIEVIRGPGGTIWGANAVNGVINIISRPSSETQGAMVTLVGGTNDRAVASVRYGGRAGGGHYRVYGKFRHTGPQLLVSGGSAGDDNTIGQGGFRIDSSPDAPARWFVSGLAYRGSLGLLGRPDGATAGGHLLGRLTRPLAGGEFALQAYYDRSSRTLPLQFRGRRDTGEVDAQQAFRAGRHHVVFGSTLRVSDARDVGISGFLFDPERRTAWNLNAFAQDEYALAPGRAYVIAGAKIGRNNYTGFELQPNLRVRLHGGERQMAWASISRAVRLPTRFDTDLRLVNPLGRVTLTGRRDFEGESVIAYEAGYRALPHPRLSLDAAVFANRYDDLRSQEVQPDGLVVLSNALNARTSGVELVATVQPAPAWRLHGSYAWFRKSLSFDPGSTDRTGGLAEGNDPSHLGALRSNVDLTDAVSLDAMLRFVGPRPAPRIDGYAELDFRIGYKLRQGWDLSLIGQNLLHAAHPELFTSASREAFRRVVLVRSVWRF